MRTILMVLTISLSTFAWGDDCCSCNFTEVRTFEATEKFQCSFDYPGHWEARYLPFDNAVDVTAPRCSDRCGGPRMMSFQISTGRDNNWKYQEEARASGTLSLRETSACGGITMNMYRSMDTSENTRTGRLIFHVGNDDNRAYDSSATFACPEAGDWQKLEALFVNSVK